MAKLNALQTGVGTEKKARRPKEVEQEEEAEDEWEGEEEEERMEEEEEENPEETMNEEEMENPAKSKGKGAKGKGKGKVGKGRKRGTTEPPETEDFMSVQLNVFLQRGMAQFVFLYVASGHKQEAKKHRLRRICERKPSGRLHVPEEIHQQWLTGDRDALMNMLAQTGWDKARFLSLQFEACMLSLGRVSIAVPAGQICPDRDQDEGESDPPVPPQEASLAHPGVYEDQTGMVKAARHLHTCL